MPLPILLAVGAFAAGKAATKTDGKEQFVAVKGKRHKDGTVGKPFIKKKPKSK
jgi:hypothetical protein